MSDIQYSGHHDVITDLGSAEKNINEMILSKNIAAALCKRWPVENGHAWAINVDGEQGICHIYNLALSNKFGFTLKLIDLVNDPNYKVAINAAGEILERYNIRRRGRADNDLGLLKKDFTGEYCFDGHCALNRGRTVKSSMKINQRKAKLNTPKDPAPRVIMPVTREREVYGR